MTPTLLGRWQTRIFLMWTVGAFITLCFSTGLWGNPPGLSYWAVMFYLTLLGLGWDLLYMYIQGFRWDQDWPAAYQWLAAIWEGIFFLIFWALLGDGFGIILPLTENLSLGWFLVHYGSVWVGVFLASQTIMRLLFPHWRFYGGRWL